MTTSIWRRYIQYFKPYQRQLIGNIMLSAIRPIFVIPTLLIIKKIFDEVIPNENIMDIWKWCGIILLLQLLNVLVEGFCRFHNLKITKKVIFTIREQLTKKYYDWTYQTFIHQDKSQLHTIVIHDMERIDVMTTNLISFIFPALVIITGFLGYILYVFPLAILFILIAFGIIAIVDYYNRKKVKSSFQSFHTSNELLSKSIWRGLNFMRLSKMKVAQDQMLAEHSNRTSSYLKSGFQIGWQTSLRQYIQNNLLFFINVLVLIIFSSLVIMKTITLGEFLSFYAVLAFIRSYTNQVINRSNTLIQGNVSLKTILNILDLNDDLFYKGTKVVSFEKQINISNLHFKYGEKWILQDINLSIRKGERIAIIGDNGSGKTTLIKLLVGLYEPQKGKIHIDQLPIETIDIRHFRTQVGILFQDEALFDGTIAENISFGSAQYSLIQIQHIAQLALAHDFIKKLPNGYHTNIGSLGNKLSGGQRQRILLARTLIHQPHLIILDEPTNHLDLETTHSLLHNLSNLPQKPAIIVISHLAKLNDYVDKIYELKTGKLQPYIPF